MESICSQQCISDKVWIITLHKNNEWTQVFIDIHLHAPSMNSWEKNKSAVIKFYIEYSFHYFFYWMLTAVCGDKDFSLKWKIALKLFPKIALIFTI